MASPAEPAGDDPWGAVGGTPAPPAAGYDWGSGTAPEGPIGEVDPRWLKVRQGLTFVRYGAMGGIGFPISLIFLIMLAALTGMRPDQLPTLFMLSAMVALGLNVLGVVGMFFCAGIPPESGQNNLALGPPSVPSSPWAFCWWRS